MTVVKLFVLPAPHKSVIHCNRRPWISLSWYKCWEEVSEAIFAVGYWQKKKKQGNGHEVTICFRSSFVWVWICVDILRFTHSASTVDGPYSLFTVLGFN